MPSHPVRSIVLSGGGARGAYEVGVLAYIFTQLPPALLQRARIKLLCGTSVGAIHACFLGAFAHVPDYNIGALVQVWRNFALGKLLRLGNMELLRLPMDIKRLFSPTDHQQGIFLNAPVLHKIVKQDIDWQHLRQNLNGGLLDAVTVSTTHIASGKTVVFIDSPRGIPSWTRDQRRIAQPTQMGPMHALASAAIPLLFSAIAIDGKYYCDGGLRQNTPLSPALRLGADRVLVIPVGHGREVQPTVAAAEPSAPSADEAYPGPTLLLGKVFNALLLDHLDYDLAQLRGFNRLLEDGVRAYGESFIDTLGKTSREVRGAGYRRVDTVVVRPSCDLGLVAADYLERGLVARDLRPLARKLLSWVARTEGHAEGDAADLLSYLLFDGPLCSRLIELGMADADAARADLLAYFAD
jgi:NTE family protein